MSSSSAPTHVECKIRIAVEATVDAHDDAARKYSVTLYWVDQLPLSMPDEFLQNGKIRIV